MATSAENFKDTSGPVPWDIRQLEGKTQIGKLEIAQAFIHQGHGNQDLNFPIAGVTPISNVAVSLCEVTGLDHIPFLGLASMAVYNVVPLNGSVQIRISIGWQTDILVRIAFLVA